MGSEARGAERGKNNARDCGSAVGFHPSDEEQGADKSGFRMAGDTAGRPYGFTACLAPCMCQARWGHAARLVARPSGRGGTWASAEGRRHGRRLGHEGDAPGEDGWGGRRRDAAWRAWHRLRVRQRGRQAGHWLRPSWRRRAWQRWTLHCDGSGGGGRSGFGCGHKRTRVYSLGVHSHAAAAPCVRWRCVGSQMAACLAAGACGQCHS